MTVCGAESVTCTRSAMRIPVTLTLELRPAGLFSGIDWFTVTGGATRLVSAGRLVQLCASATAAPASTAPKP